MRCLWPLSCCDFGCESRWGHVYLPFVSVVWCQVEASASGWSLVQRSPTDCGLSLRNQELCYEDALGVDHILAAFLSIYRWRFSFTSRRPHPWRNGRRMGCVQPVWVEAQGVPWVGNPSTVVKGMSAWAPVVTVYDGLYSFVLNNSRAGFI
jgi:hypothetical protein